MWKRIRILSLPAAPAGEVEDGRAPGCHILIMQMLLAHGHRMTKTTVKLLGMVIFKYFSQPMFDLYFSPVSSSSTSSILRCRLHRLFLVSPWRYNNDFSTSTFLIPRPPLESFTRTSRSSLVGPSSSSRGFYLSRRRRPRPFFARSFSAKSRHSH